MANPNMVSALLQRGQQFGQGNPMISAGQFNPMRTVPGVPTPRPNPLTAQAQVPGQPLSLAPPGGAPTSMDFAGIKGPQWNNGQFQNFWNRANGSY